jgi:hypothetical protein
LQDQIEARIVFYGGRGHFVSSLSSSR